MWSYLRHALFSCKMLRIQCNWESSEPRQLIKDSLGTQSNSVQSLSKSYLFLPGANSVYCEAKKCLSHIPVIIPPSLILFQNIISFLVTSLLPLVQKNINSHHGSSQIAECNTVMAHSTVYQPYNVSYIRTLAITGILQYISITNS